MKLVFVVQKVYGLNLCMHMHAQRKQKKVRLVFAEYRMEAKATTILGRSKQNNTIRRMNDQASRGHRANGTGHQAS